MLPCSWYWLKFQPLVAGSTCSCVAASPSVAEKNWALPRVTVRLADTAARLAGSCVRAFMCAGLGVAGLVGGKVGRRNSSNQVRVTEHQTDSGKGRGMIAATYAIAHTRTHTQSQSHTHTITITHTMPHQEQACGRAARRAVCGVVREVVLGVHQQVHDGVGDQYLWGAREVRQLRACAPGFVGKDEMRARPGPVSEGVRVDGACVCVEGSQLTCMR